MEEGEQVLNWTMIGEAIAATHHACLLWARALFPVGKLFVQQARAHPTITLSVLGLVCVLLLLRMALRSHFVAQIRRRVARMSNAVVTKYVNTKAWIARKSLVVAAVAPHLLYFSSVYFLDRMFPSVTALLLSDDVFYVACGIVPVVSATVVLTSSPVNPQAVHSWVKYFALFYFVVFLLTIPGVSLLLQINAVAHFRKALFYWMLMPLIDGTNSVYALIHPLLSPFIQLIPTNLDQGVIGQTLRTLSNMYVLPQRFLEPILAALHGGVVTLIAVPFLLNFGSVTYLGGNIIGMVYPAVMSLGTEDKNAHRRWLTYWILFSVVFAVDTLASPVTSWVPFFYHARLLFFLWLQLPEFAIAERIVRFLLGLVRGGGGGNGGNGGNGGGNGGNGGAGAGAGTSTGASAGTGAGTGASAGGAGAGAGPTGRSPQRQAIIADDNVVQQTISNEKPPVSKNSPQSEVRRRQVKNEDDNEE